MESGWRCEARGDRLAYHLHGNFEVEQARSLSADAQRRLADAGRRWEVMFTLNDVSRVSVEARSELAGLQAWLAAHARRCVYVSNRPMFRGVALWVIHTAPDAGARVFPTHGQAEAWMAESISRLDFIRERARASLARLQARLGARADA